MPRQSSNPRTPAQLTVGALVLLFATQLVGCSADEPVAPPSTDATATADLTVPRSISIGAPQALPVPGNCLWAVPADIDDRNTVVGWADLCEHGRAHAVRWEASGSWSWLPEVDGAPVLPIALGRRGEVYAETRVIAGAQQQYVIIDARGGVTRLALPPTSAWQYVTVGGPNRAGTFVLADRAVYGGTQFYLWNGRGRRELIPPPPAGTSFEATGLNDHDVVVGTLTHEAGTGEAVTWSRRDGYRPLPPVGGATYAWGLAIDARYRVYGESLLPPEPGCPFSDPGALTRRPTAWPGRDAGRLLQAAGPLCVASVTYRDTRDDGIAVGDFYERSAEEHNRAFVASAGGLFALAPCELGDETGSECHGSGINRGGLMVGLFISADHSRGTPVLWTVGTR